MHNNVLRPLAPLKRRLLLTISLRKRIDARCKGSAPRKAQDPICISPSTSHSGSVPPLSRYRHGTPLVALINAPQSKSRALPYRTSYTANDILSFLIKTLLLQLGPRRPHLVALKSSPYDSSAARTWRQSQHAPQST